MIDSLQYLDGRGGVAETGDIAWHRAVRIAPGIEARLAALGLDSVTVRTLLAEETRPRAVPVGDGVIVILRGINTNPKSMPEDMVSVRLWIDGHRIVSVQLRALQAVEDLAVSLGEGNGPKGTGDFLGQLADLLTDRMHTVVDGLDGELDRLEDIDQGGSTGRQRVELARIRRKIGILRRFIGPQRDALQTLVVEPLAWQSSLQERRMVETVDRITRLVEQLDEMHLRASVAQESLSGLVAEKLNRTMVLLSVIAGIFMPLGFVTGLLGMNVAGIPFAQSDWAFGIVGAALVAFGTFEYWLFRRMGLF